MMNNVLYHLHPVKVKRHGVRLSYTLCLGGLSFFLFILLTITGIFLMFYYRPTATQACADAQGLSTSVAFGPLVRNMHRWGRTSWCSPSSCTWPGLLHGAYKPPARVQLDRRRRPAAPDPAPVFTGYLLPWDQLALWAVTVGTNMAGFVPVLRHR